MEYKVVIASPLFGDFEAFVAELIAEGWRPIGGVSMDDGNCAQAMIRTKEDHE